MLKKKTIVIHSGGMDSSICLALAAKEFGKEEVLSLSFSYNQRHSSELIQAEKICQIWGIEHLVLDISCLQEITENALTHHSLDIIHPKDKPPNTLVVGRNGLMAWLGSIHAHHLSARFIYLGVMELEAANSGYRDCSRHYMDLLQGILRIDLNDPHFEIRTPLISMNKKETLALADKMGILDFLLAETISCYQGLPHEGCKTCPACLLRNEGIGQFNLEKKSLKRLIIQYG